MRHLAWWMRAVGTLHLLIGFGAVFLQSGPRLYLGGESSSAAHRFAVDSWVMIGLEWLVLGAVLILASRNPYQHRMLAVAVIGFEFFRGIVHDVYMIVRGYDPLPLVAWIVVHSITIALGLAFLRSAPGDVAAREASPLDEAAVGARGAPRAGVGSIRSSHLHSILWPMSLVAMPLPEELTEGRRRPK